MSMHTIPKALQERLATLEQRNTAPLERPSAAALFAALGITPDPWQVALLESTAPRMLLNIHRQGGKSQAAALLALSAALYDGQLVLVVSPSLRQSRELFRKVLVAYRALGKPIAAHVENQLELELVNGGRVVALPGSEATIRGFSKAGLLILEEAARVEDELYLATRPFLAISKGRLILMSTPWGCRGFYHAAWKERHLWQYWEQKAADCKRISKDFLEEEKRTLGWWFYSSEYECAFNDSIDSVFRSSDIERMLDTSMTSWNLTLT